MEMYKDLYETSRTWGLDAAASIGRAQAKISIAGSILAVMDSEMSADQLESYLEEVRQLLAEADKTLDKNFR